MSAVKNDSVKFKTYLDKAKQAGATLSEKTFPRPHLRQAIYYAQQGNRELASREFKIALTIDEKFFGKNSDRLLIVLEPYMDFLQDINDTKDLKAMTALREQIANSTSK